MALCRLWTSWGIKADVVIGHSLGEYTALYASEVLTASDVLYLMGRRTILLKASSTMQTHAMLAVHATSEATKQTLRSLFRNLEIACINGPEDILLSGSVQSIDEADQKLKYNNLRPTVLNILFALTSLSRSHTRSSREICRCSDFHETKGPGGFPSTSIGRQG